MRRALLLLLTILVVSSADARANGTVNSGTMLQGTLTTSLSSATAQVGDPVIINNAHDASGSITGTLYGHITSVRPASRGVHAQLDFVIDRLQTSGASYTVNAQSKGILPPGASVGRQNTSVLLGALAGAILGRSLGHTPASMIAGLIVGAGTGFLLTSNDYQNITLPQGSTVKVLLTSVTRTQSMATSSPGQ